MQARPRNLSQSESDPIHRSRPCLDTTPPRRNVRIHRGPRRGKWTSSQGHSPGSPTCVPFAGGDVSYLGRQTADAAFAWGNSKTASAALDEALALAGLTSGMRGYDISRPIAEC